MNMNARHLAHIGSPTHLVPLKDYLDIQKIDSSKCLLIITYSSSFGVSKEDFGKAGLCNDDWGEVLFHKLWATNEFVLTKVIRIFNFKKFVEHRILDSYDKYITTLYNTRYGKHIANSINFAELIFLDEGNAIFAHCRQRNKNLNERKRTLLLFLLLGLKINEVYSITYFSKYELNIAPNDKLINYTPLSINFKIDKKKILFIGSPYVNANIISEKYYFELLKYLKNKFEDDKVVIEYYAHRRETKKELNKIKQAFGFVINDTKLPIEQELLNYEAGIPYTIVGLYSSALVNLKKMINPDKTVKVVAFQFDFNQLIKKEMQVILNDIYMDFVNQGITVVKI